MVKIAQNGHEFYSKGEVPHAEKLSAMPGNHLRGDQTQGEYRLRYLERLLEESMQHISSNMCRNFINHVNVHIAKALQLNDLPVVFWISFILIYFA